MTARVSVSVDGPPVHRRTAGSPYSAAWTGGPSTLTETRAVIARYIDAQRRDGYAYGAVVERGSSDLVGEAGLKPLDDVGPEIEVGYAFAVASQRRGYATEVARAIAATAFGPMQLERVYATAHPENAGSRHVLAKLGFTSVPTPPTGNSDLLYHVLERR